MSLPVSIRDWNRVGDADFIYATWMSSFCNSGYARAVPKPIYNLSQRGRIDRILERENLFCHIACHPETPELIYGYIVGEAPATIHYIYVKGAYRKLGIGKALAGALDWKEPIIYTHKSPHIWVEAKIKDGKAFNKCLYDPYWFEREFR